MKQMREQISHLQDCISKKKVSIKGLQPELMKGAESVLNVLVCNEDETKLQLLGQDVKDLKAIGLEVLPKNAAQEVRESDEKAQTPQAPSRLPPCGLEGLVVPKLRNDWRPASPTLWQPAMTLLERRTTTMTRRRKFRWWNYIDQGHFGPVWGPVQCAKGVFSLPNFACVLTSSLAIVLKGRVRSEFGRLFRRKGDIHLLCSFYLLLYPFILNLRMLVLCLQGGSLLKKLCFMQTCVTHTMYCAHIHKNVKPDLWMGYL